MTRTELELKLNQDRAWVLATWTAFSPEDLTRPLTVSREDPATKWSALDHLAHLAGIETVFNGIIRRYVVGHPVPIAIMRNADGSKASMDEVMARVHELNEIWVQEHRGKTLSEVIALGQRVRAETLALLAELTDEQLQEKVPDAPWADGTLAGILGVNGDHARQHHGWVTRSLATATS